MRAVHGAVELDAQGFITTDSTLVTSAPYVFTAGDVRSGSSKQVASAVGEVVPAAVARQRTLGAG